MLLAKWSLLAFASFSKVQFMQHCLLERYVQVKRICRLIIVNKLNPSLIFCIRAKDSRLSFDVRKFKSIIFIL